ncbi:hypothetical protein DAEQUDRAFT_725881 [Daedalea quercina L-15889]|uniref:Uncharacterized protein n=1 Tax=Daedalea quercina L-15889 TaxID=1314783 RepID=A0A165QTM6_9APHY|nr:hypothetical protein DAEQUDRAFT_725881 [Daedalea quercina L-15889]
MDRCPAELWVRIFTFACTDSGCTGRSLCHVSRYIRDVSRPVQLQSIAVSGAYELRCLAELLESRRPEDRRVLHLCIAHHKEPSGKTSHPPLESLSDSELLELLIYRQYHPGELADIVKRLPDDVRLGQAANLTEERIEAFIQSLDRVLRVASPHLESFTLQVGVLSLNQRSAGPHIHCPTILSKFSFPRLEELTILDSLGIPRETSPADDYGGLPVLPSLKRLHLIDCYTHLPALLRSAPSLTHLRMSGVTQLSTNLTTVLHGLIDPDAASRRRLEDTATAQASGTHLQQIIISPSAQLHTAAHRALTFYGLKEMARNSDKLILLRSDRAAAPVYGLPEARWDWLQRIEGKEGCWGYQPADRDPDTVRRLVAYYG